MNIYHCPDCNNNIKLGAKYCEECGTKLKWPKKESNNKTIAHKANDSISLPINIDSLHELEISSTLLFFLAALGGPILSIIISSRQRKIRKWLARLSNEECDISEFQKYMRSIRRCGIWAIVLNSIFIVMNFLSLIVGGSFYITGPLFGGIGVVLGIHIMKVANSILNESEGESIYTYKLSDGTGSGHGIFKDTTSEKRSNNEDGNHESEEDNYDFMDEDF